jgi:hypothetical protein
MKLNKTFIFITAFLFSGFMRLSAQDLSLWHADTLHMANTAEHAHHLSHEEKAVIQLLNLVRLNGKAFVKRVAEPYIHEKGIHVDMYVATLYLDLKRAHGHEPLKPHDELHKAAAHHAHDTGHHGLIGHDSSDGTPLMARLERFHKGESMSESIVYGYKHALDIVMQLLIDEAVPSKINRKNLLSDTYKYVGVSIKHHKVHEHNCVVDLSSN